jgi:hypothetical protein
MTRANKILILIGILSLVLMAVQIWQAKRGSYQQAGRGGDTYIGPGTYKAGNGSSSGKGGDFNIKAGDGGSITNK